MTYRLTLLILITFSLSSQAQVGELDARGCSYTEPQPWLMISDCHRVQGDLKKVKEERVSASAGKIAAICVAMENMLSEEGYVTGNTRIVTGPTVEWVQRRCKDQVTDLDEAVRYYEGQLQDSEKNLKDEEKDFAKRRLQVERDHQELTRLERRIKNIEPSQIAKFFGRSLSEEDTQKLEQMKQRAKYLKGKTAEIKLAVSDESSVTSESLRKAGKIAAQQSEAEVLRSDVSRICTHLELMVNYKGVISPSASIGHSYQCPEDRSPEERANPAAPTPGVGSPSTVN